MKPNFWAASMPRAKGLLADKGFEADWFHQTLAERFVKTHVLSKSNRRMPINHEGIPYRRCNKIENMFGRLKDWHRIATRYERCAHTFKSAICIAAIANFWL